MKLHLTFYFSPRIHFPAPGLTDVSELPRSYSATPVRLEIPHTLSAEGRRKKSSIDSALVVKTDSQSINQLFFRTANQSINRFSGQPINQSTVFPDSKNKNILSSAHCHKPGRMIGLLQPMRIQSWTDEQANRNSRFSDPPRPLNKVRRQLYSIKTYQSFPRITEEMIQQSILPIFLPENCLHILHKALLRRDNLPEKN